MAEFHTPEGTPSSHYLLVGLASVVFVLGAARYLSHPSRDRVSVEDRRGSHRLDILNKLRLEEEKKLSSLEWLNKDSGVARIPIELAMKLAAKDLSAKPSGPSAIKVEVPVVVPSGDAPALPSAPSGARTVQFPAFPDSQAVPAAAPAVQP